VQGYQRALSGPLLDRIDLRVAVGRPPLEALSAEPQGEPSAVVLERVLLARERQFDRQGCLNARLHPAQLRRQSRLLPAARQALNRWSEERGLTARGYHRAWRVARTAADLEDSAEIGTQHVLEALGYRISDAAA
jgi:magnesium chelatase family protein